MLLTHHRPGAEPQRRALKLFRHGPSRTGLETGHAQRLLGGRVGSQQGVERTSRLAHVAGSGLTCG